MAPSPPGRSAIEQPLLDRVALEAVMARYFQGIDRNDLAQVRACFTADVKGTYANRGTVTGVDPMLSMLRSHFEAMENGAIRVCTHFMGTFNVDRLEADSAETETYALAFLVRAAGTAQNPGDADIVAMRSLRYLDRWRRGGDNGLGWQICERIHTLDWSTQVAPDFATNMAKRVMRLP
jgi:hypothetical protein